MAWAVCVDCKEQKYWRAKRGARLKDFRCDACGGKLKKDLRGWDKEGA